MKDRKIYKKVDRKIDWKIARYKDIEIKIDRKIDWNIARYIDRYRDKDRCQDRLI